MTTQRKSDKAPPRIGHLDSLSGVLKEMAAVYRESRLGHSSVEDSQKWVSMLRCMRDVIETMALERIEQRLEQLEGGHVPDNAPHEQRPN